MELLKVDIKGQIVNPGIYTVSKSSRVIDVIELSGGLTTNANTSVINLSKKVTDEMVDLARAELKPSKPDTVEINSDTAPAMSALNP